MENKISPNTLSIIIYDDSRDSLIRNFAKFQKNCNRLVILKNAKNIIRNKNQVQNLIFNQNEKSMINMMENIHIYIFMAYNDKNRFLKINYSTNEIYPHFAYINTILSDIENKDNKNIKYYGYFKPSNIPLDSRNFSYYIPKDINFSFLLFDHEIHYFRNDSEYIEKMKSLMQVNNCDVNKDCENIEDSEDSEEPIYYDIDQINDVGNIKNNDGIMKVIVDNDNIPNTNLRRSGPYFDIDERCINEYPLRPDRLISERGDYDVPRKRHCPPYDNDNCRSYKKGRYVKPIYPFLARK